jgi:hypothetical protein
MKKLVNLYHYVFSKHQEYEQKLLEQYMNSQNTAQNNASNKTASTSRCVKQYYHYSIVCKLITVQYIFKKICLKNILNEIPACECHQYEKF